MKNFIRLTGLSAETEQETPDYEAGMSTTQPQCSVSCIISYYSAVTQVNLMAAHTLGAFRAVCRRWNTKA
jgi:hypothetical protein